MSYRLMASTCKDGDCPSIHLDEATGDVIVRGPHASDPTREVDVRYSAQQWASLLGQIGRT